MWKKLLVWFLLVPSFSFAQSHVEYISEKCDSMAMINKHDIDVINNVFMQRNQLKELNRVNDNIIYNLEVENAFLDSIINNQKLTIQNNQIIKSDLEKANNDLRKQYEKDIRKQRNKTTSFQTLSGIGLIVIIILLL